MMRGISRGKGSKLHPRADVVHNRKAEEVFRKIPSAMIDDTEPRRKSNLRALRERANLTQRQLSNSANVTERNIHDWEKGVSVPRLDRAIILARALGVSLKQLSLELGLDVDGVPDDQPQPKDKSTEA